jgi:hypothetical protein
MLIARNVYLAQNSGGEENKMMQSFGNELMELMKKYGIKEIKPLSMNAEINSDGEGQMHGFIITAKTTETA